MSVEYRHILSNNDVETPRLKKNKLKIIYFLSVVFGVFILSAAASIAWSFAGDRTPIVGLSSTCIHRFWNLASTAAGLAKRTTSVLPRQERLSILCDFPLCCDRGDHTLCHQILSVWTNNHRSDGKNNSRVPVRGKGKLF